MTIQIYTYKEWISEAKKKFGDDPKKWRFVCPKCKTEQSIQDLLDAGVEEKSIDAYAAFSCVGRFTNDKGCNWTLGGLFQIHDIEVIMLDGTKRKSFKFAEC